MELAGMDPVLGLGLFAFALLLLALPLAFWKVSSEKTSGLVTLLIATANLALTAQLVLRWWQSGHFPISNLYESLCFLAWACTLTQLLVERSWPTPIVAAAATPMGLGCIAFASFALPDQLQAASQPSSPNTLNTAVRVRVPFWLTFCQLAAAPRTFF